MQQRPVAARAHWWERPISAMWRLVASGIVGLAGALAVVAFLPWQLAVLTGWDASGLTFLVIVLPQIAVADGPRTAALATREDDSRDTAHFLVLGACAAGLVAVVFALGHAKQYGGGERHLVITLAIVTVALSWTVVNTVFTLRYAHFFYSAVGEAIDFNVTSEDGRPDYRDFAYLAFTIGMTYQVSDTNLRNRTMRRTVLYHAIVSYLFGVVIVAAAVNVVAGLVA